MQVTHAVLNRRAVLASDGATQQLLQELLPALALIQQRHPSMGPHELRSRIRLVDADLLDETITYGRQVLLLAGYTLAPAP